MICIFKCSMGQKKLDMVLKGVDLTEFSSISKKLPRARERTWISITNWLFKAFGLNRDEHEISVMAVISRREPVFWELLPLEGTYGGRTDGAGPSEAAPNSATQPTGRCGCRVNNDGLV